MKKPQRVKLAHDEITVEAAAKLIEVSQSTVYRYMRRGWIPYARRGTVIVLKKSVPTKVKIAMQMPGPLEWQNKIQWAPEDLFDFKPQQIELMPQSVEIKDLKQECSDKPTELFKIARKLKSLGEYDLAGQLALKAAEAM